MWRKKLSRHNSKWISKNTDWLFVVDQIWKRAGLASVLFSSFSFASCQELGWLLGSGWRWPLWSALAPDDHIWWTCLHALLCYSMWNHSKPQGMGVLDSSRENKSVSGMGLQRPVLRNTKFLEALGTLPGCHVECQPSIGLTQAVSSSSLAQGIFLGPGLYS